MRRSLNTARLAAAVMVLGMASLPASTTAACQDQSVGTAPVEERMVKETLSALRALADRACPADSEIEVLGPAVLSWDADAKTFPTGRMESPNDRLPAKEYGKRRVHWEFCDRASRVSLRSGSEGSTPEMRWQSIGGVWHCFTSAPGQPADLEIRRGLSSDFAEVKLLSVFNGCVAFPSVLSTRSLAEHLATLKCTMTQASTDSTTDRTADSTIVRWESPRASGRVEIEVELGALDRRLRRVSYTQYRSSDSPGGSPVSKVVMAVDAWDETPEFSGLPRRAYIWSGSFASNEIAGVTVKPRLNYIEVERISLDAAVSCDEMQRVPEVPRHTTVRDDALRIRYTIGGTSLWIDGRTAKLEKPIERVITTELPALLEGRRLP